MHKNEDATQRKRIINKSKRNSNEPLLLLQDRKQNSEFLLKIAQVQVLVPVEVKSKPKFDSQGTGLSTFSEAASVLYKEI